MTINATLIQKHDDGCVTYRIELIDPDNLDNPVRAEAVIFNGEFELMEPIHDEQEQQ